MDIKDLYKTYKDYLESMKNSNNSDESFEWWIEIDNFKKEHNIKGMYSGVMRMNDGTEYSESL